MTLRTEIARFFRVHVFSIRIFMLNIFNLVFWILAIAGFRVGVQRGIDAHSWTIGMVAGCIGLAAGSVLGVAFLAFFYWLYRRRELRTGGTGGQ